VIKACGDHRYLAPGSAFKHQRHKIKASNFINTSWLAEEIEKKNGSKKRIFQSYLVFSPRKTDEANSCKTSWNLARPETSLSSQNAVY